MFTVPKTETIQFRREEHSWAQPIQVDATQDAVSCEIAASCAAQKLGLRAIGGAVTIEVILFAV